MLFDIGWPELMLIGAIALVVIGPKDLPRAMRVAGYWIRKARTMSRELQNGIDQMIREAELDEMHEELRKATEFDLDKHLQNTIDPTGELAESIKPPEVPDYFDATSPTHEPEPAQGELALPAPHETALPQPPLVAENAPEPAPHADAAPTPAAEAPQTSHPPAPSPT